MNQRLTSFDGRQRFIARVERPERYEQLFAILKEAEPMIARGAGLSYCAASAGEGICAVSTARFNRILALDRERGRITVEPGLTIGDLFDRVTEEGWYFPVLPGHASITLGGCAAFNVHGKTQFDTGNFIDYVEGFKLFHPDKGEIECDRARNAPLFYLTIGGLGLTGFITQMTLRLLPLRAKTVRVQKRLVGSLDEAVKLMRDVSQSGGKLYSWNDLNRKGNDFGRGVVYSEEAVLTGPEVPKRAQRSLTASSRGAVMPGSFFFAASTRLFCNLYFLKEKRCNHSVLMHLKDSCFPINGKEIYFDLFGRKGFREYQMLIPFIHWENALPEIRKTIEKAGIPITLGSLKIFKASPSPSYLNFCMDGVCLTLDVPATDPADKFFDTLDDIVIRYRGLANLSKDSRLSAGTAKKMFPEYQKFKDALMAFDPQKRFSSALRQRLHV